MPIERRLLASSNQRYIKQNTYEFRQFQQELAELDRKNDTARQSEPLFRR